MVLQQLAIANFLENGLSILVNDRHFRAPSLGVVGGDGGHSHGACGTAVCGASPRKSFEHLAEMSLEGLLQLLHFLPQGGAGRWHGSCAEAAAAGLSLRFA